MKFKGILIVLFLALLGRTAYIYWQSITAPCGSPLQYSIGSVDPKFSMDESSFKRDVLAAESVWETSLGRQFFKYVPDSKFKINLIYDERQKAVDLKQKTEFGLSSAEDNFRELDKEFNKMKSDYESIVASHERLIAAFKAASEQYEKDVSYWNSQGGAPEGEYQRLQKSQQSLNTKTQALNAEADSINRMNTSLSALLEERNAAARSYNKVVEDYNAKFGSGLEFDQAEYTGSAINVYEFKDHKDLTLALSHELGHALGMGHVENSSSVMYYKTGNQTLTPTLEDLSELRRACKLKG